MLARFVVRLACSNALSTGLALFLWHELGFALWPGVAQVMLYLLGLIYGFCGLWGWICHQTGRWVQGSYVALLLKSGGAWVFTLILAAIVLSALTVIAPILGYVFIFKDLLEALFDR